MDFNKMMRPEVRHFEPYLPGKPIQEVKRELGLKKIVKLASNENAIGAPAKAVSALSKRNLDIFRYPEGPGTLVRRALARHLSVEPSEVILGAGSDELIELLGKTFFNRGDEIVVSEHAFVRYKMAGDLMGIRTLSVPMKDDRHDLAGMAARIGPRTKALFIANPNNPTGTYVGKKETDAFFAVLSRKKAKPFIVFDEAYYEFARGLAPDYPETLSYFKKGFNVMVLRTFSKIYGLAGMRIGYGVARKEAVAALDRVRPPFNVTSLSQTAALAALSDAAHLKRSLSVIRQGLDYLTSELDRLGLEYMPTTANFLLVKVAPVKGRELFRELLKKGVIVRAMDEYDYPEHVRITVGLPAENRFLIRQLREVLKRP